MLRCRSKGGLLPSGVSVRSLACLLLAVEVVGILLGFTLAAGCGTALSFEHIYSTIVVKQ